MMNTYGTLLRIVVLALLLTGGWFAISAAMYGAVIWSAGYAFEWTMAFAAFAAVLMLRMFVPRNVFR